MILNQEQIRRMTEGGGGSAIGGGGGGKIDPSALAGMATMQWVNENYLSIEFFSKLFKAYDSATPTPNEVAPNDTESTITNIKAMFGFWTEQYISALGQNSGGGGGAIALTDLVDVAISSPTNGQVLMYNATSGKWYNGTVSAGGGGTVTSVAMTVPTGLNVSGSPITSSGTFSITFANGYALPTTADVQKGVTAYGWGDHAQAGYLTSSDLTGYATQQWVGQQGFLTSVAFSDLTSHPSTLSGYGITDAYINSGTIYLGSNTITPLTSFTETDPTVPAWAKASTKPSYAFSEITGSVAFSQLPTLYWANVAVSDSSSNNTEPRFKTININGFTIEYDSTNQALKFNGTIYATGGVSALGAGSGGGGGATALTDLVDVAISSPTNGQAIVYNATSGKWENQTIGGGGGGTLSSIGLVMPTGFSVSPSTLTADGSFTVSFANGYALPTTADVNKGATAYGWGNHAQAGYATQTWVGQQGFLTSSDISDMATKTWVGQQGFLTSSDISDMATKTWVGSQGYLKSVSFGDLTSHPTTISGYGITDAKIQNGTITLGSNSITPLTSFTETDPTVPAWAKASTKPSYAFSEITGSVAFSQLPTLYWANVAISSSSDKTTEPQFANVRLRNNTANYGSYLYFGDGSYCYLYEDTDDHLKIYGSKGVEITTGSGYNLTWRGNVVATQAWVSNQDYLTSVAFGDLTSHPSTLSGYGITDAIGSGTTFWGRTASNGSVTGDMSSVGSITMNGIIYNDGNYLLFKSSVNAVGLMVEGGMTDNGVTRASFGFHPAQQSNVTAWWNNKQILQLKQSSSEAFVDIPNGILQIGDARLIWDSTNGAIKVQRSDGTAANFYATGAVSALGMNSGSSGTIATLNITNQILFDDNDNGGTIMTDGGPLILSTNDNNDYIKVDDMVSMDGYNSWHILRSGNAYFAESVRSPKFYLNATRYIYLDNGTLKYYNGSTSKTISVY